MHKLLLLLLISTVYCQVPTDDKKLDDLYRYIKSIFGKPPGSPVTTDTIGDNSNITGNTNTTADNGNITVNTATTGTTGDNGNITGNTGTTGIFTTQVSPTPLEIMNQNPPNMVPNVQVNDVESPECKLPDGRRGECVAYYLCNINNNTIIRDGAGVIDIRSGTYTGYVVQMRLHDGLCESYVDACCDVDDRRPANDPIKPNKSNKKKREGCGWRNPEGADFQTTGDVDGETKFGEFPWVCAVLRVTPDKLDGKTINVFVGAGSLIHPSVVLTSAHHLVKEHKLKIRAGEWDTQTIKEIYPYQDRNVTSFVTHENYNSVNLFYDVAVVFLSAPMDLAPNVGVACLPPPKAKTPEGTRCFATGWGKDKFGMEGQYQSILKKVEVPVVDHMKCQQQLRLTRLFKYFELHSTFMCAGGEEGKDACRGDGGAPLSCPIATQQDRFVQSGIVAWGIGCAMAGVPGVYTDVAELRDWIDDKVASEGYDTKVYSY